MTASYTINAVTRRSGACVTTENMTEPRERICCHDINKALNKFPDAITRYGNDGPFTCLTQHPGFTRNCTYPEVLENAWLSYRQQYGQNAYNGDGKESSLYRHIAYRQLARFLFGVVGKDNRLVLPSCCVTIMRLLFPDESNTYTGFLLAN